MNVARICSKIVHITLYVCTHHLEKILVRKHREQTSDGQNQNKISIIQ